MAVIPELLEPPSLDHGVAGQEAKREQHSQGLVRKIFPKSERHKNYIFSELRFKAGLSCPKDRPIATLLTHSFHISFMYITNAQYILIHKGCPEAFNRVK